ncbi:hypothetical protein M885DRAFT_533573 [Pelagophyceae sp. CCMP2097]|nr:hypothetical protein M885DRAFT_533573 [Pelagophyceae sp. CCMP2097]
MTIGKTLRPTRTAIQNLKPSPVLFVAADLTPLAVDFRALEARCRERSSWSATSLGSTMGAAAFLSMTLRNSSSQSISPGCTGGSSSPSRRAPTTRRRENVAAPGLGAPECAAGAAEAGEGGAPRHDQGLGRRQAHHDRPPHLDSDSRVLAQEISPKS